ncbi:MAG: P-II family nitrogen regulator [Candidatus Scalindua sp. AMX11]|nr:MAG: P-II family nitrogen regulator [Candidatus Scalindua sp.]NOG82287.1 P-II family nitrogen regulator [Planctomycetota bacterium]RZV65911.1 MAG: P-II family nitrogen regulator [Candidatus Scalindua sp. SCAELEC01]TDE63570.1 MAG: P-II family nitrogen regulator [Candidatus Scalindua sp. AMX11]GJQ60019.1 MAG: nitrogen regulatory protein P-II [Candidatus Scalindua sp.]
MKKIEAIIRPEKFEMVKDALSEKGFSGMSVTQIKGHGDQKGVSEVWRGKRYRVDLLDKTKLEIVVADDAEKEVVEIILDVAKTGSIGDGNIYIHDISTVYRIRNGEQGEI